MDAKSQALVGLLDQFQVPEDRSSRLAIKDAAIRLLTRLRTPSEFQVPEDSSSRLAIKDAALRLLTRLQTPSEHIHVICNANQSLHAVLHTTIDMGLWGAWAADGGEEKGLEELVKLVPGGCDADVLRRLLRLLTAWHVIQETGEDTYKRAPLTEALGDPNSGPSGFVKWCEHSHPPTHALPSFLASSSYRSPGTLSHNSYTTTREDGLDMFARTRADPDGFGRVFAEFMRSLTGTKIPWTDIFDTGTLLKGADSHGEDRAPLLVDVAGGLGTDVKLFLSRNADTDIPNGAIVLQDQPSVLASSGMDALDARVRAMPYDFFTPQPVAGARAYFFHAVLHDWPDEDALRVLKNTASAMKKGYSKLLLCEVCLPPTGASAVQAGMDVRMMAMLGGRERTEGSWRGLLGDAGLRLVKVWRAEAGWESVLEAELA